MKKMFALVVLVLICAVIVYVTTPSEVCRYAAWVRSGDTVTSLMDNAGVEYDYSASLAATIAANPGVDMEVLAPCQDVIIVLVK
jgi:hypothetical protein